MRLEGESLDERWISFASQTEDLVETLPLFGAARQAFYKTCFEWKSPPDRLAYVKAAVRVFREREETSLPQVDSPVVFWINEAREVQLEAILPVRKEVERLGLKTLMIVTPRAAEAIPSDSGPVAVFKFPYRFEDMRQWGVVGEALRSRYPELLGDGAGAVLTANGRAAESAARELRRIFTAIRPRMVVTPLDHLLPASAACVVGREMGIPTLVLLHGAVSAYNAPLTADEMGVWGELSREQMMAHGVAGERLVALGSPRHDHPPRLEDPKAASELRRIFDLPEDRPVLVFFSNANDLYRNTPEAVAGCAEWLAAAAEKLKDKLSFVVRLHPKESGDFYKPYPQLRCFKNECDLATTLAGADIVSALCSTALLEGLLYRKPVLQFRADGWPELADNWQRGLSTRVSSADHLVDLLGGLLEPAARLRMAAEQQTFGEQAFANSGHAAEAVARYIQSRCAPLSN